MRKVKVISKKYDGSLRDEYETALVAETDKTITLFSVPGLPYWDHRKAARFEAPDGLLEIYFKHQVVNWCYRENVCSENMKKEMNHGYSSIARSARGQTREGSGG